VGIVLPKLRLGLSFAELIVQCGPRRDRNAHGRELACPQEPKHWPIRPVGAIVMKNLIRNRPITVIRCTLVAVVVLALFAGGCNSSTSPSSPSGPCVIGQVPTDPECMNPPNLLTVTIKNGVFSPNPVMVKVGQTVNWLNSDAIAHTATDPGVFDIGSIAPTSAHSDNGDGVTFNTVGTFNYHCTLHANETATVIVTK
jgi:plastocyanin